MWQLRRLPFQRIQVHVSKASSLMILIFHSGPKFLRMSRYHKVSKESDYCYIRGEDYQQTLPYISSYQKAESTGDKVLDAFIKHFSKGRTFEDFIRRLPSVVRQPGQFKGFMKHINDDCKDANTQALVYDLLKMSENIDVPAKDILLKNSKKAREKMHNICFKSDALETFVGHVSFLKDCNRITDDDFNSIMHHIAFLHLYVAAIMRELSIAKPNNGIRLFPQTEADKQAIERTCSLSPSMFSGYGSSLPDRDVRESPHQADLSGRMYEGGMSD